MPILQELAKYLTASGGTNKEVKAQYKTQLDVLGELQEKIEGLFQQPSLRNSSQQSVIKLRRDFDKIKATVKSMEKGVEDSLERQKQNLAAQAAAHSVTADASQQQVLQQMREEEDVSDFCVPCQSISNPFSFIYSFIILQRLQLEMMREREEEIRNINRGMHQVNEIYKDLAHIVGSQQEQIDTIENQMEESKINAEAGLKQVERANEKYGNQCVIS